MEHKQSNEVDFTRLETKITFVESVIRRSTVQHATFPGNDADYLGGTLVKIERTDIGLPSASPMTDGGICSENRASLNLDDRVAGAKAVPIAYDPSSPTSDAECYIQQELESSPKLQGTWRSVLRSALDLITQLSRNPMSAENPQSLFVCKGASLQNIHYPSIELLSWMLREFDSTKIGLHVSYLFKYLSPQTLKRMGLALIVQDGDEETLLLYSICVNFRAAQFLNMALLEESDREVSQKLRIAAEKYRSSAEMALTSIRLMTPPSVALLQAQLCGANMSRAAGNSAACWAFASAACKTCMDLKLSPFLEEEDDELYYCFVCCYIYDKAFALNQGRRPYLGGIESMSSTRPVTMTGPGPFNLMTVYLELARIQGIISSELNCKKFLANAPQQRYKASLVENLLLQMDGLRKKMDTASHSTPNLHTYML